MPKKKPKEQLIEAESTDLTVIEGSSDQEYAIGASQAGVFALGRMTDTEFEERLDLMQKAEVRIRQIFERALTKGDTEEFDLMTMKGIPKPFITQNGSNRVKQILGLVAVPGESIITGDGKESPLRVQTLMWLHLGSKTGPCVGGAWGVASSWEPKFRYRNAKRTCPECDGMFIHESKPDKEWYKPSKHYYCYKNKGGCGANFDIRDDRITGQTLGQVDHEDPEETIETLQRFSEKRADVAGTRRFSGISRWTNLDPDAPGYRDKPQPQEAPPTHVGSQPVIEPDSTVEVVEPKPKAAKAAKKTEPAKGRWIPEPFVFKFVEGLFGLPCFKRDYAKVTEKYNEYLFSVEHQNPRDWWRAVERIRGEIKRRTGELPSVPDNVASWALQQLSEE